MKKFRLDQILREILSGDAGTFEDNAPFTEIPSWDSMTHMILITRVESEFGFQMTGDEIASLATIGDLRQIVDRVEP